MFVCSTNCSSWALARSNPLAGKRVLVTRPAHQIDSFARALKGAGAAVIAAPLIAFEPPDDSSGLRRAIREAASYTWIVFTSANGVAAFPDSVETGGARIAAIGNSTAAALRTRGLRVDLVPAQSVAESLAQALIASGEAADRVLVFRAQEARDVLPALLRESGRRVDVAAAYKTVMVHDPQLASKVAQCDIITFTSASTVRAFTSNLVDAAAIARAKTVACIGPITAQAAREAGLRVDAVSASFSANGLADALLNLAG